MRRWPYAVVRDWTRHSNRVHWSSSTLLSHELRFNWSIPDSRKRRLDLCGNWYICTWEIFVIASYKLGRSFAPQVDFSFKEIPTSLLSFILHGSAESLTLAYPTGTVSISISLDLNQLTGLRTPFGYYVDWLIHIDRKFVSTRSNTVNILWSI